MNYKEYRVLECRLVGYLPDGTPMYYIECYGSTSWTKPTTVMNGSAICAGSIAIETDSGTACFWDEESADWVPVGSSEEE